MEFQIENNILNIVSNGSIFIHNVEVFVEYYGGMFNAPIITPKNNWELSNSNKTAFNDGFEINISDGPDNGLTVRTKYTFKNRYDAVNTLCAMKGYLDETFAKGIENNAARVNGLESLEMQCPCHSVHTVDGFEYNSVDYTVLETVDKKAYSFGVMTWDKWFSLCAYMRDGSVKCYTRLNAMPFDKGDVIESELFWLAEQPDVITAHERYAEAVAEKHGVKRNENENPVGYCSWYYYGDGISKDRLMENVNFLKERKEQLPIKYVQIDAGWYNCWGEWEANDKFKDMKEVADEIKAAGYIPGLWFAPFGCEKKSQIPKDHPDWFVKGKDGELWKDPFYCLDYSNPEVREYISNLFRKVTQEWGFKYLKLDIVTACICAGQYYDKDATPASNVRLGFKTIKEAVGDDVFVLGCTAPFGPSLGYVDGMRVSCDIFERWNSLISVFNATLKRFHFHRRWFLNDGDCLIVRESQNEDEQCFRPCIRTAEENRTFVTAMAASGGILMLSDKMPLLSEEQLEEISTLFPLNQEAAKPLDIMDGIVPGILDFGERNGAHIIALINWGDAPKTFNLRQESCTVKEFWRKQVFEHKGGNFEYTLKPHDSAILYFIDKNCQNPCKIGQKSIL